MRCPFCSAQETRVMDSRLAEDGDQVRRRRECSACKARFTTYESAELALPKVIKSNDVREPFEQQKLRSGILRALEKRPVESDAIEATIAGIVRRLRATAEREVTSRQIGEYVMEALEQLDRVAYVRFASVYRSFEDVSQFKEMVERLEQSSKE